MMGLNDFTDSNIVNNCTNNNNSMIKISAKAFIDQNGKFNVTLQTNGVKNSVIQENYFEKIEIFGINEDRIDYSVIYYQFKEKILISEGFIFTKLF